MIRGKLTLSLLSAAAAAVALVPATADADVVTPEVVKPQVVTPQVVTPAPSAAPVPGAASTATETAPSGPTVDGGPGRTLNRYEGYRADYGWDPSDKYPCHLPSGTPFVGGQSACEQTIQAEMFIYEPEETMVKVLVDAFVRPFSDLARQFTPDRSNSPDPAPNGPSSPQDPAADTPDEGGDEQGQAEEDCQCSLPEGGGARPLDDETPKSEE